MELSNNMIGQFVQRLNDRILGGLPGLLAHRQMAPSVRPLVSFNEHDYPNAKKGSVLILFYPYDGDIRIVFIKRPDYDGVHSGQVAFPGGRIEVGETAMMAALREAQEEIGLATDQVKIFNQLSNLYIPPSNFFVFPFLAFAEQRPEFFPDPKEVEYIIESPVGVILDPAIKGVMELRRNDEIIQAPYYRIQNHEVWGATALMLSELEFLLRENFI